MPTTRLESFAKYAGIATVGVEWLALLFYYILVPAYFGGKYPISYYAYLPQTKFIFACCYTLAGFFFWIFIHHHLNKYYQVPIKIFVVSMVFFIALAIIPFDPTDPMSSKIHQYLGMLSSIFWLIGMLFLIKNAQNKIVSLVTFFTMIISLVPFFLFLSAPKGSQLIFFLEASSWLLWQLWIIWISFYSYGHKKI
ncbi:MAG TPA: DUF998 domain-containing protein [Patescibacteria group bacterium]|nr:DUF998 domain-containing protein [Patescibacteria group bacterium]